MKINELKKEIIIACSSKEEMTTTRDKIHSQLVGNPDYINSKIILTTSDDMCDGSINEVSIFIYFDCINVPEFKI